MTTKPFYVAGEWRTGEGTLDVHSPYDDSVVADARRPDRRGRGGRGAPPQPRRSRNRATCPPTRGPRR